MTAPSVKTLFFSNKRCDEVLLTPSSASQMAPTSAEAETINDTMVLQIEPIIQDHNRPEKCGQSQALASRGTTLLLFPAQGTVRAMSGQLRGTSTVTARRGPRACVLSPLSDAPQSVMVSENEPLLL